MFSLSVWFMRKEGDPSWPAGPGAEWSRSLARLRSVGWSRGGRASRPATKGRGKTLDLLIFSRNSKKNIKIALNAQFCRIISSIQLLEIFGMEQKDRRTNRD